MTNAEAKLRTGMDKQERSKLLDWASGVSGLPLRHISEVQNGAVFCCIISLICDLDLSMVNYDAQEECECLANYRLLQSVSKAGRVRGLNHKAKLSHWGRMSVCESDAWEFLAILQRCLRKAGKGSLCYEIEDDATPPPAPLCSRKGQKQALGFPIASSPQHRGFAPPPFLTEAAAPPPLLACDDAAKQTLATALLGSGLSEVVDGRISAAPGGGAVRSFAPQLLDSGSQGFERNSSGAMSVSAHDAEPASPNSLASDQDRAFPGFLLGAAARSSLRSAMECQ